MHPEVHLMIATSISMIITSILHCIMEHVPKRQSFLRLYLIDNFRDSGLMMRCFYSRVIKNATCDYLVNEYDLFSYLINASIFQLVMVIQYYCPKINHHARCLLGALIIFEFLAQYVASLNLWFKIDLLTVYMFVWQLTSLVLNWIFLYLLPPIRIIEQGSYCMYTAFIAWVGHFIFFRYLPLTINVFLLWILSIIDIFICLHHRGPLYCPNETNETSVRREKCDTGIYYVRGVDKWKKSASLGLGDFFVYNMLALLALQPSSSIITIICVTFGSIVSVQVGSLLTHWLSCLVKKSSFAGVPLPVITFSMYLLILNIIVPEKFNQCQ